MPDFRLVANAAAIKGHHAHCREIHRIAMELCLGGGALTL